MADNADNEKRERAEAEEARRQKILEKGKARMAKVSGLQQEADAEDQETKSSSNARMQAMRRRRFKKGGKAKEEAASEEAKSDDKKEAASTTEAKPEEPKEETKVEEAPKATTETKTEDTTAEDTAATTKKYKGVAKMRREKMLQKKKEDAAKAAEEEAKNPVSQHTAVQAKRNKRKKQPVLPILMYLLTTFLLFLAGLDVGLQHADEGILVNRDFAPKSFSFDKLNPWGGTSNAPIKDLGSDEDLYARGLAEEQDEFNTGEDPVDYVPNIDPVFRVDLDEVTKGPGFLNQMARGAIKVHRFFLYLATELPFKMFAVPAQLMSYPPIMCLVAIMIRQIFGKVVFGAKLPNAIEEDVRNAKEITDVLTMMKNAVKGMVVGAFPMVVNLYEVFTFLKSDMYIMLCGVFVGLLVSTWSLSADGGLPPVGMEEPLIPTPDPPVLPVDGIADEL